MARTESLHQNVGIAVQGRLGGLIVLALLCALIISPSAAAELLPLGAPNTTGGAVTGLPNQFGFTNVSIGNLSIYSMNFTFGSVQYPPLYTANPDVVPWELWIVFLLLGAGGAFASFKIKREEPAAQIVSATIGMIFSAFAFIWAGLIGFSTVASNTQGFLLSAQPSYVTSGAVDYALMLNTIQPVYTVYSPPYLWAALLAIFFVAFGGFINGIYNQMMKTTEELKRIRDPTGKTPRYGVVDLNTGEEVR